MFGHTEQRFYYETVNALHYATALLEPQTTFIIEDHNLTHFTNSSYDVLLPHLISSCARHVHEHGHVSSMRATYHAF